MLLLILLVVVPLTGLIGLVAKQAASVSSDLKPRIQEQLERTRAGNFELPEWVPYRDRFVTEDVATKAGELAGSAGKVLVGKLSDASKGTAVFFLDLFIMLYAMFYFFGHGRELRERMLKLMPLPDESRRPLMDKGMSMARATIKGTVIIGVIQGALGGIAFAFAGISGAALWGTIMAIASVIPGLGTALVWLPVVIFLLVTGELGWAIGLAVWFLAVVGTVDNVLRPRLVGGDTQMPDLLILVSTLGGLSLFGVAGLIIGPVIAAIFVGAWEVYEHVFA